MYTMGERSIQHIFFIKHISSAVIYMKIECTAQPGVSYVNVCQVFF